MTARLTADDLMARVIRTDAGCWEYQGRDGNEGGYRSAGGDWAHRTAHRMFIGPIPDGFHVDHLCNNRICINPEHLEAVTPQENYRRAKARRERCSNGHLWADNERYRRADGTRECRACGREKEARRRERIRAGVTERKFLPEHHGTATGYGYGCRCDACREGHRRYTVERIARKGWPSVKPHQHGTRTGYGYGCRCDPCRAAARDAARRRRAGAARPLRTAA